MPSSIAPQGFWKLAGWSSKRYSRCRVTFESGVSGLRLTSTAFSLEWSVRCSSFIGMNGAFQSLRVFQRPDVCSIWCVSPSCLGTHILKPHNRRKWRTIRSIHTSVGFLAAPSSSSVTQHPGSGGRTTNSSPGSVEGHWRRSCSNSTSGSGPTPPV